MLASLLTVALVVIGAFFGIGLLVSYLKYERLHDAAAHENSGVASPRDVFLLRIAGRLASGRTADPFTVVLAEAEAPVSADALLAALRPRVRRGDDALALDGRRVGMIFGAERRRAGTILARVRGALSAEAGIAGVRFALASHPWDGSTAEALLAAAESAPFDALASVLEAGDSIPPPEADEYTDPLTGALKMERVSLAAHKYVAKCRRENRPVSLLYLDIGDLDVLQQRYGSAAGDGALKAAADVLLRRLRESDLIGRLDGGGFLAVADCAPAEAAKMAGRVIEGIRAAAVPVGQNAAHFTVNIGIAGYPDHGGATRVLFDAAEAALAAARRQGRNTFALYSRGQPRADHFQQQRARDRL